MIAGPGLVVETVVVRVEPRSVAGDPVVEQVDDLLVAGARGGSGVQHAADHRPDRGADVLGGGAVHDPDHVGELRPPRPLVEQLDALHRSVRLVVAVHEPRRRLVVPVEQQAARSADVVRVLALAQEPLPLVVAGAERRQPPVEPASAHRQLARGEVGGVLARRVGPVEGEAELVRRLPEALRRRGLALGHVLERREVEGVAAEGRALARQGVGLAVDRRGAEHRAVHRDVVAQAASRRAGRR